MSSKVRSKQLNARRLKAQKVWLESLYEQYHRAEYIGSDPLIFVMKYEHPLDREIAALISASLAYGNVKAMQPAIAQVLSLMPSGPQEYLMQTSAARIHHDFRGFRYRVTNDELMAGLLIGIKSVLKSYGSLWQCFQVHDDEKQPDLMAGLDGLVSAIEAGSGQGLLPHLLSKPSKGSACKRMMLFLKWMVRCDEIDPGGWPVDPSRLIMPIDTHVFQMAQGLGWTERKTVNLHMAMEITAVLRKMNPADPLKYDFAMTRPGILNEEVPWVKGVMSSSS